MNKNLLLDEIRIYRDQWKAHRFSPDVVGDPNYVRGVLDGINMVMRIIRDYRVHGKDPK